MYSEASAEPTIIPTLLMCPCIMEKHARSSRCGTLLGSTMTSSRAIIRFEYKPSMMSIRSTQAKLDKKSVSRRMGASVDNVGYLRSARHLLQQPRVSQQFLVP